jgi:hypothetical protein
MAFGFKLRQVRTKGAYTVEELYDEICEHEFTAGRPKLTKHGLTTLITFPALDLNNQVWILPAQFKPPYTKWTIQKNAEAGVGNMVVKDVFSELTHGYSDLSGAFGKNAKRIEELVVATARELEELGL